jgi:hypothetical protein
LILTITLTKMILFLTMKKRVTMTATMSGWQKMNLHLGMIVAFQQVEKHWKTWLNQSSSVQNVVLIRTIKQRVKASHIHIHYQQLHSGCQLIWEWLVFMTRPNDNLRYTFTEKVLMHADLQGPFARNCFWRFSGLWYTEWEGHELIILSM